jgi:hypothetical protein
MMLLIVVIMQDKRSFRTWTLLTYIEALVTTLQDHKPSHSSCYLITPPTPDGDAVAQTKTVDLGWGLGNMVTQTVLREAKRNV